MTAQMTFEEFCAQQRIAPQEPAAFAAFLNMVANGSWEGRFEDVPEVG